MSLLAVLAVVAAVIVTAGPVGRRLPPRTQAVMTTGAALGSALAWLSVLGVLSARVLLAVSPIRTLLGLPTRGLAVRHTVPWAVSAMATAAL